MPPRDDRGIMGRLEREAELAAERERERLEALARRERIAEHYRRQGHAGGYGGTHNPDGCTADTCRCTTPSWSTRNPNGRGGGGGVGGNMGGSGGGMGGSGGGMGGSGGGMG